ncbi:MAG: motility protein A [Alphaproteobacteria bacterium]
MSINTLLSFIFALSLFIFAIFIGTSNVLIFLDFSSLLMVVGGTFAATFLGQEARYVMMALRAIFGMFAVYKQGRSILNQDVGRIIRWGYLVQQKGLPALEGELGKVRNDPFLTFGVELLLSGYNGTDVRDSLENVMQTTYERSMVVVSILKGMAQAAPAFGMIGTLVGLIIMLDNMAGDPSMLGKGLAVALNTTLYGVLLARFSLIPAANKLTQRHQITRFRHTLLIEGMSNLAERRNPRLIQDRMNSLLDPAIRFNIDKQIRN